MMRSLRRAVHAAALAAAVAAFGVQPALATGPWTLDVTPGTVASGASATFSFTATSHDSALKIGCLAIPVPAELHPGSAWITGSNSPAPWVAWIDGDLVYVAVESGAGVNKLEAGEWVSFAVAGHGGAPGSYPVTGVAYSNHGCTENGRALAATPTVVVTGDSPPPPPSPVPTPSPTSPPDPTPKVTPKPSATPSPTPAPSVASTPPLSPRPRSTPAPDVPLTTDPDAGAPAAPSGPSGPEAPPATASQAADSSESDRPESALPPPGGSASSGGSATSGAVEPVVLRVAADRDLRRDDVGLALGPLGALDGLGVWAVPSAIVGGPGVLVILWVAMQSGVAAAWIPAISRLRDGRGGARSTLATSRI